AQISDDDYKHVEAIIRSMTPYERRHPDKIGTSRKRRIALGSGSERADVNQLLSQFKQMQTMMGQFGAMARKGKLPADLPLDLQAPGGGLGGPMAPRQRQRQPQPARKARRRR
ncbi:MAG: signal recognition particle protein, partial [Chloroflexota bacterium]|nr:signal recognition particle protein [Chloroflexota bacterium]